jgi:hypothetical protein
MAKRWILSGAGLAGALAGWKYSNNLLITAFAQPEIPYEVGTPIALDLAMKAACVLLAAGSLALAFAPLRRTWFAGAAVVGAAAAVWFMQTPVKVEYSMDSIKRMAFWRNGSDLYTATPEFTQWAADFGDWMAAQESYSREAYVVHVKLGDYLLRVGEHQRSIQQFELALQRLEANSDVADAETFREKKEQILRWLAISNLRAGEIDHCIDMVNAESCIFPLRGEGIWANPTGAIKAQEWLLKLLAHDPDSLVGRYLLNVAHMAAGTFPDGVPPQWLLPRSAWAEGAPAPHFTNVGPELNVHQFTPAGGVVMDDFDNDGRLDVITCCIYKDVSLKYFHNDGDGKFSDWTERAGLQDQKGGLSLVQADYDNDGWMDIYVPRGAWLGGRGLVRHSLLRNRGDGTFEDVTEKAGMAGPDWPALAAQWCDYDNDGDLDLYKGNERLQNGDQAPSQLFRNNGDGTFTDVAREAGVENMRYTRGLCWGDYDNDGDWDLYVSNFNELNRLYRNDGTGKFEDVGVALGVAEQNDDPKKQRSFQSWFFDANNDGWLDLFSASFPLSGEGGKVDGIAATMFGLAPIDETCKFWLNDGKGGFLDRTEEYGLAKSASVMGANIGDLDSDGWMDFYLSTGAPSFEVFVPKVAYMNQQGKGFADATATAGLGHLQKGHGVAFGDIDNDGDLDLYAQLGGWYLDDGYFNALFRNDGLTEGTHWVTLRLRGVRSNRFGVGCRVRAVTLENGQERSIYALCGTGASFGGNSTQVELGLGKADRLLRLEILWPATGETQVIENSPMDSVLLIEEGASSCQKVTVLPMRLGAMD